MVTQRYLHNTNEHKNYVEKHQSSLLNIARPQPPSVVTCCFVFVSFRAPDFLFVVYLSVSSCRAVLCCAVVSHLVTCGLVTQERHLACDLDSPTRLFVHLPPLSSPKTKNNYETNTITKPKTNQTKKQQASKTQTSHKLSALKNNILDPHLGMNFTVLTLHKQKNIRIPPFHFGVVLQIISKDP